jgi:hypothetical protein
MSKIESDLEKWRKSLSLRTDIHFPDIYKMFIRGLTTKKLGVDIDDLFYTLKYALGINPCNRDLA